MLRRRLKIDVIDGFRLGQSSGVSGHVRVRLRAWGMHFV